MKVRSTKRNERRGVTVVEGAVILLVTLMLIIGMLDLGIGVMRYNQVSDAARHGARHVIVHGSVSAEPWGTEKIGPIKANANSVLAKAVRSRIPQVDPNSVELEAHWLDEENEPGSRVKVCVRATYRPLLGIVFGNHTITLHGSSIMQIQH